MAARKRSTRGKGRRSKASREFVSEAEEILERIREDLSQLAEVAVGGSEADPELVNGLFRSAHSLKGLSGMFGMQGMSELAHHFEEGLDRLRMGRSSVDATGLALFDDAVTLFSAILEKLGDDTARPEYEQKVADLVEGLDRWAQEPAVEGDAGPALELPATLLRALTEYEEHRLNENVRKGRAIHVVDVDFEISSFEEGLAEASRAIREVGEVISTLPSPGEAPESQIRFSLLAATEVSGTELASRLELAPGAVRTARDALYTPHQGQEAPQDAPRPEIPATSEKRAASDAPEEIRSLKSISETVRVDIRKLDELMNLVGELAIQRGAFKAVAARLAGDPSTSRIGVDLEKLQRSLDRKLQELQAAVLEVRMVPLRQVFDKLSRVVRRLRLDLGKEVRLEIQGADTELDKLIVEELVDPLMHVVRNGFDHAIEPAAERAAAGKPDEGRIRIEATQRGNDVVIAVSDDGRGIDAEAVRAKAVERGILSAGVELSRKEILELVFAPGLSTRSEVTGTSGRGVGMDVVRANIAALGGVVDIDSTAGVGTTISITLPITLAIIQALIVGVGEHRFAVPLNSVRETLLVEPSEVQRSDGRELMNLRGEPLALRRLAEEFRLGAAHASEKLYVVVLGMGDARMGLLVDRLEGQQDTVIKPIQGPVATVRGIAGATELGDQRAVLVLDVSALIEDKTKGVEA